MFKNFKVLTKYKSLIKLLTLTWGDPDLIIKHLLGEVKLKELKIFGAPYGRGKIHLAAGSVVSWSKPRANVKNILSELKN